MLRLFKFCVVRFKAANLSRKVVKMSVVKICELCQSNKEAIYNLKDSIRPPKDLYYDGIGYLSAAFQQILNVSARRPDRKICQECHNEFQRVYHFIEECIRVQGQHYELSANIKEESSLDVEAVTLLRISPVDIEAQNYLDEFQDDTETGDRSLDNENVIGAYETQFDGSNPAVKENNTLNDENCEKHYDCTICGRKYRLANSLSQHRKLHMGITYSCRKCPAVFNFIQGRNSHERKHKANILKIPCNICGWMFATSLSMKQHRIKNHTDKDQQLKTKAIEKKSAENFDLDDETIAEMVNDGSIDEDTLGEHKAPDNGAIYKCDKCPAVFNFPQGRNVHEKNHKTGILKFPCDVCGWMFPTLLSVKQHINRKHAKKGMGEDFESTCEVDQVDETNSIENFSRDGDLAAETPADPSTDDGSLGQQNAPNRDTIYKCDKCPAAFNFHQGRNAHEKKHKAGTLKFPCGVCGWMFPTILSVRQHISKRHAKKDKHKTKDEELKTIQAFESNYDEEMACKEEQEGDIEMIAIKEHNEEVKHDGSEDEELVDFEIAAISDHSQEEDKILIEGFSLADEGPKADSFSAVSLDEKLITIPVIGPYWDDPVPENDEVDPLSETSHSVKRSVPVSKRKTVKLKSKPRKAPIRDANQSLVCDVCNWKFPNEISLKRHRLVHELKPYACTQCDKTFSKPRALQTHEIIHGTELRYGCHLCDKRFSILADFTEHKLDAHPEQQQAVQQKLYDSDGNRIYVCEKCDTTYYTMQGLRHHLRTHLGATFSCTQCPRTFFYSQSLRVHMHVHQGISFKCRECDAVFKRPSSRKQHYIKAHTDIKFICNICNAEFGSKGLLYSHQAVHREKTIACSKCHVKCGSIRQLRNHELSRHPQTKLYCDQCAAEFFDTTGLNAHRRVHTGELFECNECKWKFMTQGELDLHGSVHKIANFICEECNAKFARLRDFNAHKRIHANDTFDCTQCPAKFLFAGSLYKHKEIHKDPHTMPRTSTTVPASAIEEGPREVFSCDQCHVEYGTLQALESHKATHIKTQYECNICLVKFAKRDLLRTHRLTHLGSKAFKCDECDSMFSKSLDFAAHKRMHSGDTLNCEVCNASFLRPDRLKEHMRIHTGETFDCDQCDAKFTTRWTLKKHGLKHAAEKPYACDQCSFKTFYKNVMESHRQIHEVGYVGRCKKPRIERVD